MLYHAIWVSKITCSEAVMFLYKSVEDHSSVSVYKIAV